MRYIGQVGNGEYAKLDSITLNGSNTVYGLFKSSVGYSVSDPAELIVVLNGIVQEPSTDYSISQGNQIVFNNAPASDDDLHIVALLPPGRDNVKTYLTISNYANSTFASEIQGPSLNVSGVASISGNVDVGGNQTITGNLSVTGDFSQSSSIILKDDILTINNSLNIINDLRGVTYTRKDSGMHESGLIAEEVENVLPFLVNKNNNIKGIKYTNIIAYLIEAVKQLSKDVDNLKNK